MRTFMLLSFLAIVSYSYSQTVVQIDDSGEPHELKNKPAPLFNGVALDNQEISLESLKGKIVLINFWHLRCPSCYIEIIGLNTLMEKFPKEEFVVISFLDNTKDESLAQLELASNGYRIKKPAYNNDRIDFQVIPDAREIMKLYTDEISFPRTFIIDQNGVITFYMGGFASKRGIPGEVTSEDLFVKEIERLRATAR